MLILCFLCGDKVPDGADVRTAECPPADRVYAAPQTADCAGALYPEKNPVVIEGLGGRDAGVSGGGSLAAFDALLGNFRVLWQDDDRDVRIAFVVPAATVRAILADRLIDADDFRDGACEGGAAILTHAEGGRLVLDDHRTL